MNILIIDNSIAFTGAFKCAFNEAELLSGNHSFHFLLPADSSAVSVLKERGMAVSTLPMREINRTITGILSYPFYLLKNGIALRKILRTNNIDVIQVNDFYNLLGVLAKITGFRGKLITYVRLLPAVVPLPLRKIWIAFAMKYSVHIIAVSDAVLRQLPENKKAIRIYDPVRLTENIKNRKEEGKEDQVLCLYLANYIRGKGQEYAVEAFANAYKKNSKLRLRFAGGDMGLAKNKAFKQELQAKVRALNLEDAVSFNLFSSDVEGMIKSADIVLNFSDGESFSMTCLEAAFYGTCIVATRCGGPEEIIEDRQTGILIEKQNVAAMTEAILSLSLDPSLRHTYEEAGKIYVRKKFTIDQFKHQFESALTS